MSRIAYVNGRYVPHADAFVHVEDRGFQFADGVYEVCAVAGGKLLDLEGHMARLWRSLRELRIEAPMGEPALLIVMGEMMRRNRVRHGTLYLQVTRGAAKRDHPFPAGSVRPSLVMTARAGKPARQSAQGQAGIAVITQPDLRWGRCDIKSVALLANVLSIQAARDAGADDAWLIDGEGKVTEGTRSNAWIVDQDGRLVTRFLDNHILHGITRATLIRVAAERGIEIVERAFTPEEAKAARECFMTSASSMVMPVTAIDGAPIGNGEPGSIALALRDAYIDAVEREAAARD